MAPLARIYYSMWLHSCLFVYGMNSKKFYSVAYLLWVLNLTFFSSSIHSALLWYDYLLCYNYMQPSFIRLQTRFPLFSLVSIFSFQILPHNSGGDTSQLHKERLTVFPCFLTVCICSCSSAPKIWSVFSSLSAISFISSRIFLWQNSMLLVASSQRKRFYQKSICKIFQSMWVVTSTAKGEIQLENRTECKRIFPPVSWNHTHTHTCYEDYFLSQSGLTRFSTHCVHLLLQKYLAKPRLWLIHKNC